MLSHKGRIGMRDKMIALRNPEPVVESLLAKAIWQGAKKFTARGFLMAVVILCGVAWRAEAAASTASEADKALEQTSEALLERTKKNILAIAKMLDDRLNEILNLSRTGSTNLEKVLEAAYDTVVDHYAKAFQAGRASLEALRDAGVQQLKAGGFSAANIPRGFQAGGSGAWDAHEQAVSRLFQLAFPNMARNAAQFVKSVEELNAQRGTPVRLNLKNATPTLGTTASPIVGFAPFMPDDPGTRPQILSVWTVSSSLVGAPIGLGGGIAERGRGNVRVILTSSGVNLLSMRQSVPVDQNGKYEFLFRDLIAPGLYRFDASYESGHPGSDSMVIFIPQAIDAP
jgi:hypothetical protein